MSFGVIPRHIAVIMDGNGRWARERGLPRIAGHRAGIESVREVVKGCVEVGVEYLSLFTFSSENWKRPEMEVNALMTLLSGLLRTEIEELHRNGVRLSAVGRIDELPERVRGELERAKAKTAANDRLTLVLALSYGGRGEITDAVNRLLKEVAEGKIAPPIDEADFRRYLYDPSLPDPDLLVRTSGEERISNFFLWQIAYAELYVTPTLWPDFRKEQLLQALEEYGKRERRFGGVEANPQKLHLN